jgi:hypothetical protein
MPLDNQNYISELPRVGIARALNRAERGRAKLGEQ